MGTCHSDFAQQSERKAREELSSKPSLKSYKSLKKSNSIKDLKFRLSDFVGENTENFFKVYKILAPPLGKGAYGEVRKAVHLKTNEFRAIKILSVDKLSTNAKRRIIKEINIGKSLDHPNIVKIHEFFDNGEKMYIVMEYLQGEPLLEYLIKNTKYLSEKKIAQLLHQLLTAIHFMHLNGIVHRDIKSENIMYDGKVLTVIDFGTSKNFDQNQTLKNARGTPYYMAPEVIKGNYNEKCDIWSAGILLYILLTGGAPYDVFQKEDLYDKIRNQQFTTPISSIENISSDAKSLLGLMLALDPESRSSAAEALGHPFFNILDKQVEDSMMNKAVSNLESLVYKSKLQEAVYMYFLNEVVSQNEKYEIIQTFKAMDVNSDGMLSLEELKRGLRHAGRIVTDEEICELFSKVDQDKNGTISFSEYLAAAIDREKLLSEERIIRIFKIFDKVSLQGQERQDIDQRIQRDL